MKIIHIVLASVILVCNAAVSGAQTNSNAGIFSVDINSFFAGMHAMNVDNFKVLSNYTLKKKTGTYIGQVVNNVPNGIGVFKSSNGDYFALGDFKSGVLSGFCVYKLVSTDPADGCFVGTLEGKAKKGMYYYPNDKTFCLSAYDTAFYQVGWGLDMKLSDGDPFVTHYYVENGNYKYKFQYISELNTDEGLLALYYDRAYNDGGSHATEFRLFKKEYVKNCKLFASGERYFYNKEGKKIGTDDKVYGNSFNPFFAGTRLEGFYLTNTAGNNELIGYGSAAPANCSLNGNAFAAFRQGGYYGCKVGTFSNSKLNGEGIMYSNNGFIYAKRWKDDMPEGKMITMLGDGTIVITEMIGGAGNGLATAIDNANNKVFISNVSNNSKTQGFEYDFKTNTVYFGSYVNNERAKGVLISGDGKMTVVGK